MRHVVFRKDVHTCQRTQLPTVIQSARILGETEPPLLDDVNKRIIEQLQTDGRMSYAALAKVVGLSEAAVRQRVQRLLDTDVMQIVAVTDPLTLGFARQAMLGLRVEGDMRPVAAPLGEVPEVSCVVICRGGDA